jgi:hypothetical protein
MQQRRPVGRLSDEGALSGRPTVSDGRPPLEGGGEGWMVVEDDDTLLSHAGAVLTPGRPPHLQPVISAGRPAAAVVQSVGVAAGALNAVDHTAAMLFALLRARSLFAADEVCSGHGGLLRVGAADSDRHLYCSAWWAPFEMVFSGRPSAPLGALYLGGRVGGHDLLQPALSLIGRHHLEE